MQSTNQLTKTERFKAAPWFEGSKNETIAVLGTGGIGSNALYNLCKTIPANYHLCDFDSVENHNIGTQFFRPADLGKSKVSAAADIMYSFGYEGKISCFKWGIDDPIMAKYAFLPITITGFDNMKARSYAFQKWKELPNRELFIDGRLRANLYEVYSVLPGEREEAYEQTLFDDSEVDDGPCTFKQTAYFGMLIGARITNMLVNYLSNKYSQDPIYVVPFKIKELGEMCHVEII